MLLSLNRMYTEIIVVLTCLYPSFASIQIGHALSFIVSKLSDTFDWIADWTWDSRGKLAGKVGSFEWESSGFRDEGRRALFGFERRGRRESRGSRERFVGIGTNGWIL
jgi:hypothetical protein